MVGQKRNTNIDFNDIRKEDATRLGTEDYCQWYRVTIIIPSSHTQPLSPGVLHQSGQDCSPSQCSRSWWEENRQTTQGECSSFQTISYIFHVLLCSIQIAQVCNFLWWFNVNVFSCVCKSITWRLGHSVRHYVSPSIRPSFFKKFLFKSFFMRKIETSSRVQLPVMS